MGVKVAAGTCLHWSQTVVSQSPTSLTTLSSPKRKTHNDRPLVCHVIHRSALFGDTSRKLLRSVSCEIPKLPTRRGLRRASSACLDGVSGLDGFNDEEFKEQVRELALKFIVESEEDESNAGPIEFTNDSEQGISTSTSATSIPSFPSSRIDPPWLNDKRSWETDEIIPAIERKANSVDLPLSLRIIKKKNQLSEELLEAGESAVKKAFSSLVFIIGELHSYTMQMREFLFFEDLQGVLARVQKEMHASFVWLFQQIFSHTPTLMVSVMILLANFTVHSMANNLALAAPMDTVVEMESMMQNDNFINPKFDSSVIKSFSVSSFSGKAASIGGNNGGGGTFRKIASGTDGGDARFNGISSFNHHQVVPDEISGFGNPAIDSPIEADIQDKAVWNSMVEEALKMQPVLADETLDHETMQQFVTPITVEFESDKHYSDFFRTELIYQQYLSQDPKNSLLLSNYAQFLHLVHHDHDRAEVYFKAACQVKPADAEALSRYAYFLWRTKKDLEAAEETYLEAIDADPTNAYHAASYANFLWNTGGEETCYPLSTA